MPYTYYHQQDGRSLVIISEDKVPDKKHCINENEYAVVLKIWLQFSCKSYEVFPGEEEKIIKHLDNERHRNLQCFVKSHEAEGYILLPNEVVKIDEDLPFISGKIVNNKLPLTKYAFYNQPPVTHEIVKSAMKEASKDIHLPKIIRDMKNQPEENKTAISPKIIGTSEKYIEFHHKGQMFQIHFNGSEIDVVSAGHLPSLHSFAISDIVEEKDLWPSDNDLLIEADDYRRNGIGSKYDYFAGAKTLRDQLKQKYNLIPKQNG